MGGMLGGTGGGGALNQLDGGNNPGSQQGPFGQNNLGGLLMASPQNSVGGGGAFGMLSGGNTPQDRGFGIQNPAPFEMFSTGGGLADGNGAGMESLDMTGPGWGEAFFGATGRQFAQPGAGENYFAQNAQKFTQPGQGQQFWNQGAGQTFGQQGMGEKNAQGVMGQFGGGKNPTLTENAATNFNSFKATRPSISNDAGLGAYYDNAKKRSLETLGRQAAARGVYGSTSALNNEQRAITDLEAERANREADYNLRAIGENRAWEGLSGQLADAADRASANQSQNQLAWTSGLSSIANQGQQLQQDRTQAGLAGALGLDNFGLDQLNSGMRGAETSQGLALNRLQQGQSAANQAQQLQQDRGNQLFQRNMQMGNAIGGAAGDTYDQMFGGDQALMDSAMAMELGLGAEALNQSYKTQQRHKDDAQWAADMWGSIMPMMGGMGG